MKPFDPYSISSYDYDLPAHLIADRPTTRREDSRLMLIDRKSGSISSMAFHEIVRLLTPNDLLVFNDAKVMRARLHGIRESGGKTEVFLVKQREDQIWEVLAKPAKKLKKGVQVKFSDRFSCTVIEELDEGARVVRFESKDPLEEAIESHGELPIPPYMQREADASDENRYQTVYAKKNGALAAPTAGLHFSNELLQELNHKGIDSYFLTLYVGLGTFLPVQVDDIRDHPMHTEHGYLPQQTIEELQTQSSKRRISVGTTTCRTLEAVSNETGQLQPGPFETNLFIYPGYAFKNTEALLTNFHLPRSTLLMLVSAFAGPELIQEAYAKAIEEQFRFFSYGDAMLIL